MDGWMDGWMDGERLDVWDVALNWLQDLIVANKFTEDQLINFSNEQNDGNSSMHADVIL